MKGKHKTRVRERESGLWYGVQVASGPGVLRRVQEVLGCTVPRLGTLAYVGRNRALVKSKQRERYETGTLTIKGSMLLRRHF